MSSPRRDGNHYTAATGHQHAHSRITRAAPHPDVVAAAEFLLAEPDAYLYRRRYLELIAHIPGPDGTLITDYTAAEQYLLTTAEKRRKTLQNSTTLYAVDNEHWGRRTRLQPSKRLKTSPSRPVPSKFAWSATDYELNDRHRRIPIIEQQAHRREWWRQESGVLAARPEHAPGEGPCVAHPHRRAPPTPMPARPDEYPAPLAARIRYAPTVRRAPNLTGPETLSLAQYRTRLQLTRSLRRDQQGKFLPRHALDGQRNEITPLVAVKLSMSRYNSVRNISRYRRILRSQPRHRMSDQSLVLFGLHL